MGHRHRPADLGNVQAAQGRMGGRQSAAAVEEAGGAVAAGTASRASPAGLAAAAGNKRAALITGCSSGIGHEAALRLHDVGFDVYATARHLESLADLAAAGITTLRLDVTDEESMAAAVGQVTAEHGAVAILVNNAGFELAGVVEELPLSEVRRQFETNLFGLARLTQLVIPGMRESGGGRIINISSIFGRFAVPGVAYYAASKHAVAAFSDALRLELAAFGIRVVLIEPTAARTRLNANTVWAGNGASGPYRDFRRDLADWNARVYAGPPHNIAGRLSVSAANVAAAITRAATSRRPRARYPVGILARGLFLLRRWLPTAAFDAFVRAQFPVPRPVASQAQAHSGAGSRQQPD
jgi:NAD(P)-dependent dehydrogenase (short-subunit alcohol dehydrogenase family)